MKFNLKKFPLKVNQQGIDITLMTTPKLSKDDKKIIAIAEWKVGFEKELRELLDAENKNYDTAGAMVNCSEREELLSYSWGRIKMLKRILGEFE